MAKVYVNNEVMTHDLLEDAGITFNVRFRILANFYITDDDGNIIDRTKEWHYFGVTTSEYPPTTDDPVYEHNQVQFPSGFNDLSVREVEAYLYEIGLASGLNREGIK